MKRLALALACCAALAGTANAQTVPLSTVPPPGSTPTATLIFDAMRATARAASTNPAAAQAAQLSYQHAIQAYNSGDIANARAQAVQALIEANRPQFANVPILQSTIPSTSALQISPFPIAGGSVAQIDADAFVAQARGAVAACRSAHSPNAAAAAQNLASAERDDRAGRYLNVRTEARAAVDLCASAQR